MNKSVTPQELSTRNFTLTMINGCFDLGLTAGHIKALEYASTLKEKLCVAINTDASIKRIKGKERPIIPLEERILILSALKCVDYIVTFEEDTPIELIKTIMPDLLCKGGGLEEKNIPGYGIVPIIIGPYYNGISTTEKIKKMRAAGLLPTLPTLTD